MGLRCLFSLKGPELDTNDSMTVAQSKNTGKNAIDVAIKSELNFCMCVH